MSRETHRYQALILGAGLAGISAAVKLAGYGAKVLVLDENRQPGGQYLKRPLPPLGGNPAIARESMRVRGGALIRRAGAMGLPLLRGVQVCGVERDGDAGWTIWGETPDGALATWRAKHLLLATGAREKFIPFKGWTLPGVISTGGVQLLMKSAGVLPAQKVLVAGGGPLPLAVAGELVKAGAKVPALLDQNSLTAKMMILNLGFTALAKIQDGLKHQARILATGGRLLNRTVVKEARGDGQLEEVVCIRLDNSGNPVGGSERTYKTGCLAMGHGFTPNLELAQQAGCELEYDGPKGGWVVKVDHKLQTPLPGCHAAGELTGIAGAEKSHIEGTLAAIHIALSLGLVPEAQLAPELAALQDKRRRQLRLGAFINRLSALPAGIVNLIADDTILCRCEDVTMADLRREMELGVHDLSELKRKLRSGMGLCQGRTCGPILEALAGCMGMNAPQRPLPARMPVKPIRLGALLDLTQTGPEN